MKAFVQLVAASAGALAVAAIPSCASTCEEKGTCGPHEPGDDSKGGSAGNGTGGSSGGTAGAGNGGTSGVSGAAGGGGMGGEGGGEPPCDPSRSPSVESCIVSDEFAVFVSPTGADGDPGTMAEPVATFERALELAAGAKVIIACSVRTTSRSTSPKARASTVASTAPTAGPTPWTRRRASNR